MTLTLAGRVEEAKYAIRDPRIAQIVKEVRATGKKIYEFNIGDPGALRGEYGFSMPEYIRSDLIRVISTGKFDGYANEQGDPEVRDAIAADAKRRKISDAKPENVVVGNGLSELIGYLFGVTLDKGKNIVVPRPDYPLYTAMAKWYGAQVRHYDLLPEKKWSPDLKQLEAAIDPNTAWVVAIHPNNPTGSVINSESMAEMVRIVGKAGKNQVPLMSDEIYHRLRFDGKPHPAMASFSEDVPIITMDGFSKGFYSPGWRLGHVLFSNFPDTRIMDALVKVCAFRLSGNQALQMSYAHALDNLHEYAEEQKSYLNKMKERVAFGAKRVNSIPGLEVIPPEGAFYMFPRVLKGPWKTDSEFVEQLLRQEGIRVVPGSGFSMKPEDRYFRMVPLGSKEFQAEAFAKMASFMERSIGK
ncbi:MAG: aminotransferase class I/II-fold pyridoxal phosphate-dependent enzyme [Candidatus Micrarchaeota archaeon]